MDASPVPESELATSAEIITVFDLGATSCL